MLGAKWKELDDEEKKVSLSLSLYHSIINSSFLFSPMSTKLLVIKRGLRKRKLLTKFIYLLSSLLIKLIIPFLVRTRNLQVQEKTTRRKNKYVVPFLSCFVSIVRVRLYNEKYYITVHLFHLPFFLKNLLKPFHMSL